MAAPAFTHFCSLRSKCGTIVPGLWRFHEGAGDAKRPSQDIKGNLGLLQFRAQQDDAVAAAMSDLHGNGRLSLFLAHVEKPHGRNTGGSLPLTNFSNFKENSDWLGR